MADKIPDLWAAIDWGNDPDPVLEKFWFGDFRVIGQRRAGNGQRKGNIQKNTHNGTTLSVGGEGVDNKLGQPLQGGLFFKIGQKPGPIGIPENDVSGRLPDGNGDSGGNKFSHQGLSCWKWQKVQIARFSRKHLGNLWLNCTSPSVLSSARVEERPVMQFDEKVWRLVD